MGQCIDTSVGAWVRMGGSYKFFTCVVGCKAFGVETAINVGPGVLVKWQVLGLPFARFRVQDRPGSWSGRLSLPL